MCHQERLARSKTPIGRDGITCKSLETLWGQRLATMEIPRRSRQTTGGGPDRNKHDSSVGSGRFKPGSVAPQAAVARCRQQEG